MPSPSRRSLQSRSARELVRVRPARVPCRTALTTSSSTIISASSASASRPQQVSISRTNRRAVLASSGRTLSARVVTAGVSHQAEGTGSSRGMPSLTVGQGGLSSSSASPLPVATLRYANATASCMSLGTKTLAHHGVNCVLEDMLPDILCKCKTRCTFIRFVHRSPNRRTGGRQTGRTYQATCSPFANWKLQRVNYEAWRALPCRKGDKHGHYLQRHARRGTRRSPLAEKRAQQPERGVRRAGRA